MKILVFLLSICVLNSANGATSPIGLSLVPPIQAPPSTYDVKGLRLSGFWGEHQNVYGIDLGLIGNITKKKFLGASLAGGFNSTISSATVIGLQGALIANVNSGSLSVYGLQFAWGVNLNPSSASIVGLQVGIVGNLGPQTNIYGAQFGIYNNASHVFGLQLGLVNVTGSLRGLQIGLINFNHDGFLPFVPFINVGF